MTMKIRYTVPQIDSKKDVFLFAMMQSSSTTNITGLSDCAATCCHESGADFTTASFCATGDSDNVDLSSLSVRVVLNCLAESDQSIVSTLDFTVPMSGCQVVSDASDSSCPDGTFLIACNQSLACQDFITQHPCPSNTDYADEVTLSIQGGDGEITCAGPVPFAG